MQLTDKYQPQRINQFAGLAQPKAVLSSFAGRPYSSSFLFVGPSGLGKTSMAFALAREINGEVHHLASRQCDLEAVDRLCHSCHHIPMFGEGAWHVPIVDEADSMSRPAQHAFLSKLDATGMPPQTVFIFTANSTKLLEDRFRSRCREVRFTTDGLLESGVALLREIYLKEAPGRQEPDFVALLRRCGLNIRTALMEMEMEMLLVDDSINEQPAVVVDERPNQWRVVNDFVFDGYGAKVAHIVDDKGLIGIAKSFAGDRDALRAFVKDELAQREACIAAQRITPELPKPVPADRPANWNELSAAEKAWVTRRQGKGPAAQKKVSLNQGLADVAALLKQALAQVQSPSREVQ